MARDTVVESLGDAVIVVDAARRVLDMNAAARALAGWPAVWTGRLVDTVLPLLRTVRLDVGDDSSTRMAQEVDARGPPNYDVRVIRVHARHERAVARVVVARDITDQLGAEADRAALQIRVLEQQKHESLAILAGGLAHNFNNLLTGIVGNADLLAMEIQPSSRMGDSVGAILLSAQRAADLVDKMLAYAGERHGSIEHVDLDELVRDMADLMRTSAARHCTLHYDGQPATIDADPTQIRQVVMNLIINAADAVEETAGEIAVVVGVETLTGPRLRGVESSEDAIPGEYACVEVRDNGPGMDSETLGRIFSAGFYHEADGTRAGPGCSPRHRPRAPRSTSGRQHAPGRGTEFRVWLPRVVNPERAAPRSHSSQSHTSGHPQTR